MVLDTSDSMNNRADNSYQTRLTVAKSAVNDLAVQLFSNNTTENLDAVTLTLVSFNNYATTRLTQSTSLTAFQNQVNSLRATGATNWEDALSVAKGIYTRPGAEVYVIFVSDGNPTLRNTRGDSWSSWGAYQRNVLRDALGNTHVVYGDGSYYDINYDYASDQAVEIAREGKTLFSVGVFGSVDRMQSLATDAGQSDNYYSASDGTALNAAFDNIINTITNNLTYSNVKVTDGITALTATLLEGSADAFTYTKI